MAGFADVIGNIGTGSQQTLWMFLLTIIIGGLALIFVIGGLSWWWFKKRWNLRVEIKLTRSDSKITIGEWGKGMYNAKRGVVFIKRPGFLARPISMMVLDIRKYIQGEDLLTVIQVGPEDFRPVLNDSWDEHVETYINNETGEEMEIKESILNIKVDTGLNKAWKSAWEASAKKAYSLQSFFQQFQTPIAIAIVIVSVFVGFAIIWARLGTICA
ncbi:MAG: hypothetical protein ACTSQA_00985 [Candidatus Heimdallarchaeaceae archaeon]